MSRSNLSTEMGLSRNGSDHAGAGMEELAVLPLTGSPAAASAAGIVVCSVGELFGGVERHILGLLAGLRARGVSASLVVFHRGELAAQAKEAGVDVTILPERNRALLDTARTLARLFAEREVRVVHAHGYKATVFCALARRAHRFAFVKTEHGLPEPIAGRPWLALRGRFYGSLETIAIRMADASVCYVTHDLLTRCRWLHAGLRTYVIANGVPGMDRERHPRPSRLARDCFNLTIVGRLEKVKGHHVAIEALADARMPADVHLQILGTGPCEHDLRALSVTHGVADRVHFLGFRRDVHAYMAHCDVLLMPSLHEGLPYSLLEAMALGMPVVASRVGGIAEVLEDGVSGILVVAGDRAAFAGAIARLHADVALRTRLGENARRLQRTRYTLELMTERYLEVYRESASVKP